MNGIENSIMPFVSTIGFGGIVGFLLGYDLMMMVVVVVDRLQLNIMHCCQNNMVFFIR
jgi:uncharacterized membrane protein (Fun14 family)